MEFKKKLGDVEMAKILRDECLVIERRILGSKVTQGLEHRKTQSVSLGRQSKLLKTVNGEKVSVLLEFQESMSPVMD